MATSGGVAGVTGWRRWFWRHSPGIILDIGLVVAAVLAASTNGVVLWFHMIFVLLTISSLFLEFRTVALRAIVWVPAAIVIVATAVRDGETQSAELAELPLLTSILAVVLVVSHRRAGALGELERAQALLEEHHRNEREQLERQLAQAQKMDALGRLASGIAHDFNNVLTAILGHAEAIADGPPHEHALDHAQQIETAVHRSIALIDELMSFSREDDPRSPATVELNEVVGHVASMLRPLIGEDIELGLRSSSSPCCVQMRRSRLERVVVNLVVNAREAMPSGGHLTVATDTAVLDPDTDLPPGRYAILTVADTGIGVAPDKLDRVFEPFFTTKVNGGGAGLGLSTVRDIVRHSGGAVRLLGSDSGGTTVQVLLPLVDPAAEQPHDPPDARGTAAGSETVLLVEDDDDVRQRAKTLLEGGGYDVLDVTQGADALARASAHPGRIDLLVSDVVMPGMSGPQLAIAMRARQPSIRVLLMSGYAITNLPDGFLEDGAIGFLRKPFRGNDLLAQVRALLDSPPTFPGRRVPSFELTDPVQCPSREARHELAGEKAPTTR